MNPQERTETINRIVDMITELTETATSSQSEQKQEQAAENLRLIHTAIEAANATICGGIPSLISPLEAIQISKRASMIDTLNYVKALYEIQESTQDTTRSPEFYFVCRLATIYETGRIQGIREERKKRRGER